MTACHKAYMKLACLFFAQLLQESLRDDGEQLLDTMLLEVFSWFLHTGGLGEDSMRL